MSEWVDIPLATQTGEDTAGGSSYASDAELVNLMLVRNPPGSRTPFHIAHTPGLSSSLITSPGSGRIRGLLAREDGTIYIVRGTEVYYSSNGGQTWTLVPAGTMPGTDYCRMADADTHVVSVDGTNARAITAAESFACSRATFSDVAYQDGYTVFAESSTNSLYTSDLDDPKTIGALNFTTVDSAPGDLVGIMSDHRELYAFKRQSIENYYNAGNSGFPFARSSPGLVEGGALTGTQFAICKYNHTLFWVSPDLRAFSMQGHQPSPLSTTWAEKYMARYQPALTLTNTLTGAVYVLDGVLYYAVSGFNEGGQRTTLVCDVGSGLWHKRYSPLGTTYYITHMVEVPAGTYTSDSMLVAVNNTSGGSSTLFLMQNGLVNDTGASGQTTRIMTMPQISYGGVRASMYELYVDMQQATASGTMTLSWSDDGGVTYSSGISGTATNGRARFQRLGSFYQRILRLTFSINSKLAIMGVRARIDVGT